MTGRWRHGRGWRGGDDLKAATAESPLLAAWQRCFFAQQATEKVLKAALTFLGIKAPRIHNLDEIHQRLSKDWPPKPRSLGWLSLWAVETRYPVRRNPTTRDARRAAQLADEVFRSTLREMRKRGYRAR